MFVFALNVLANKTINSQSGPQQISIPHLFLL